METCAFKNCNLEGTHYNPLFQKYNCLQHQNDLHIMFFNLLKIFYNQSNICSELNCQKTAIYQDSHKKFICFDHYMKKQQQCKKVIH